MSPIFSGTERDRRVSFDEHHMKASAESLRTDTAAILQAVDRGEVVVITYRGKPRAKIVRVGAKKPFSLASSALFGLWRDRDGTAEVEAFVDRARAPRF